MFSNLSLPKKEEQFRKIIRIFFVYLRLYIKLKKKQIC
jgi:hypothetical protein